ncbi:MAG: glycoside hydrolase 43 family protein [Bacteroidaceae bacterium]|nr:glycoside hydrolase 43 family protein [Bacteroidaceae bacterium]
MKHILLLSLAFLTALQASAQSQLLWGDQGNGTYRNPVLNADYSDPDVIRVGDRYFMVSSNFNHVGMQVLESTDMVNWHFVSQIFDRYEQPGWDEMKHYARGAWAPSIRFHDGLFYVYYCTPDEGLFMATASDAHGPWSEVHQVKSVAGWEDPCPFWDEDGQAYMGRSQLGAGPIILHRMSADGRQLLDDGVTIYTGPVAEGTKWLKRNGYYYLIIPEGGVSGGWQTVLRSRDIYGPYEKRIVLEQGSTRFNGPHQGALVDTPQGEWWFYNFQQTPQLGRVLHLQPARWCDDWPLMGVDIDGNGIGEPVEVWTKPHTATSEAPSLPQTDDTFDEETLGLQWQWNHNPAEGAWSLSERKGCLTLHALPADKLKEARGTLTQMMMGFEGIATLTLDGTGLAQASAGLACIGRDFRGIGLCPEGIYTELNGERTVVSTKRPKRIHLRLTLSELQNSYQFHYSTDGKHYVPVSEPFQMREANWKGVRIGLFCYGTEGKAHFNSFEYNITK